MNVNDRNEMTGAPESVGRFSAQQGRGGEKRSAARAEPAAWAQTDNPRPDAGADWLLHQTISAPGSWATDKNPVTIRGKKFKSTSFETPAVYLTTDRLVVFERCDFWHRGSGVANWLNSSTYKRGARVKLVNCRFFELSPKDIDPAQVSRKGPGRAAHLVLLNHFEIENCEVYGTSGVLVDRAQNPEGVATVRVRYNKWRGVNGNFRDVVPEKRKESSSGANMVQVKHIYRLRNSEIAWNDFRSEPGRHGIEDIINIYNAGGYYEGTWREALASPNSDPLLIHNNFLRGAHPYPLYLFVFVAAVAVADDGGATGGGVVDGVRVRAPQKIIVDQQRV